VGRTKRHSKHREKSSTTAGESHFTMPRKTSLQIHSKKPELENSCFQLLFTFEPRRTYQQSAAHQPLVVLPVKLRCPVRRLTCVSRQICLNKSGKRHRKPSMEAGTTIKTAAAQPVCVMPTFSYHASALWPERQTNPCIWSSGLLSS